MIWHESCRIILNGVKSRWHWLHFLLVAIIAVTLELTIGSNPERLDLGSRYSCAWILKIQTDIYIWFMVIWTHDRSFWFVGICQLFQYSTCMCKRDQTVWMIFISIIIYMSMYTYIFETLEHLIFLISRNWPMTFQYILCLSARPWSSQFWRPLRDVLLMWDLSLFRAACALLSGVGQVQLNLCFDLTCPLDRLAAMICTLPCWNIRTLTALRGPGWL